MSNHKKSPFDTNLNRSNAPQRHALHGSEHYFRKGSGLDYVINTIKDASEKNDRAITSSEIMMGVCLEVRAITLTQLSHRYGHSDFLQFVSEGSQPNPEARVIECGIHVPEVTGILPEPNLIKLIELKTKLETAGTLSSAQLQEYNLHMTRLSRYPKAYKIQSSKDEALPGYGSKLEVMFYDANNFSYGGKILKVG